MSFSDFCRRPPPSDADSGCTLLRVQLPHADPDLAKPGKQDGGCVATNPALNPVLNNSATPHSALRAPSIPPQAGARSPLLRRLEVEGGRKEGVLFDAKTKSKPRALSSPRLTEPREEQEAAM